MKHIIGCWAVPVAVAMGLFWFAGWAPYLMSGPVPDPTHLVVGAIVALVYAAAARVDAYEQYKSGHEEGMDAGKRVMLARAMVATEELTRAEARRLEDPAQTGPIEIIRAERALQRKAEEAP